MIRREGWTAIARSWSVPCCAKWLALALVAGACLNPMPEEFPSSSTVSAENDGPVVPGFGAGGHGGPSLDDDGDLDGPDFFGDGVPVEAPSGAGGSGSMSQPPDAGAPPADAGGTTRAATTRLRPLDAGASPR